MSDYMTLSMTEIVELNRDLIIENLVQTNLNLLLKELNPNY